MSEVAATGESATEASVVDCTLARLDAGVALEASRRMTMPTVRRSVTAGSIHHRDSCINDRVNRIVGQVDESQVLALRSIVGDYKGIIPGRQVGGSSTGGIGGSRQGSQREDSSIPFKGIVIGIGSPTANGRSIHRGSELTIDQQRITGGLFGYYRRVDNRSGSG